MKYAELTPLYISSKFPRLKTRIVQLQSGWNGQNLSPYTLFYDVIFNDICSLVVNGAEEPQIEEYFSFIEELLCCRENTKKNKRTGNDIENLIQTGFLEYFWDTLQLYQLAQRHMGNETRKLFLNIRSYMKEPSADHK